RSVGRGGGVRRMIKVYFPSQEAPRATYPPEAPCMGEIRVKVKLINSLDEALARRGQLAPDQVRSHEADALVDTGSVRSVVPAHVIEKLGVGARGQRIVEYADGRKETVGITEPIVF